MFLQKGIVVTVLIAIGACAPVAPIPSPSYPIPGDSSLFVKDVTIPDGTEVPAGVVFRKTWKLKNNGSVYWKERYLYNVEESSDLKAVEAFIPIEETPPGKEVDITVYLKTGDKSGVYTSTWKMVDKQKKEIFPNKQGIYCQIKIL